MVIIEDQLVVGYDLQKQLQKQGWNVVFGKTIEDIVMALNNKKSGVVIASPGVLMRSYTKEVKTLTKEGNRVLQSINETMANGLKNRTADTLILNRDQDTFIRFPKPYNTVDLVNYIIECLISRREEIVRD
ncbi:MAG: hypothetical protein Q8M29_03555 [Bacteroidota bacterium]|nr:hypothetical protein [Bacteroidota bacterium]